MTTLFFAIFVKTENTFFLSKWKPQKHQFLLLVPPIILCGCFPPSPEHILNVSNLMHIVFLSRLRFRPGLRCTRKLPTWWEPAAGSDLLKLVCNFNQSNIAPGSCPVGDFLEHISSGLTVEARLSNKLLETDSEKLNFLWHSG